MWWSFKNQKTEMYIFFVYPSWSLWHMTFWPYPSVTGGKLCQKMDRFGFLKTSKISQNVLQKSITAKNVTIFFIVSTEISCPCRSFCTPYFWSRASWKWVNFVIVCLKKCIFFYSLPQNVVPKWMWDYQYRFGIAPSSLRSLGANNNQYFPPYELGLSLRYSSLISCILI